MESKRYDKRHNLIMSTFYNVDPMNEERIIQIETLRANRNLQPLKEWEVFKQEIKKYIPEPFFSHFIKPLVGVVDQENNILLFTENKKLQKHIQIRYEELLKNKIYDFYKNILKINLIKFLEEDQLVPENLKTISYLKHTSQIYQNSIQNFWSYDTFYPSKKNYEELTNLIQLEKYFRPIFIYGPSGCGKTSLCKIWVNVQKKKVYYNTIPEFINSFIISHKKKKLVEWMEQIKSYTIILLDDFQLLKSSAKKTQEEIRNLIDYFYQNNKIFVLLSDRDFLYMNLQEDLKSRLMSFYKIYLSYPDFETKKEIIKYYLNQYKIHLDEKVQEHISLKLNGDVRYIKSSIEKLAFYSVNPEKLKITEIDFILNPYYDHSNSIHIDQIVEVVCEHYGIPKEEIFRNTKEKRIAFPRHLIAYFSVKFANYTMTSVAKFLNKKDHTAILYAIKKIEELLSKDLFLQNEIENIKEKLYLKLKESM